MEYVVSEILTPTGSRTEQYLEVHNGIITALCPAQDDHADLPRLEGYLIPGFIDLQVNGGGGQFFNHCPTPEGLTEIANAHVRAGTTSLMPTLVTDDLKIMHQAADAVAELIRNEHRSILGIHFEGPGLSMEKKGVHPEQHVRSLAEEELAIYLRPDLGRVMVTVAPEQVSPEMIAELASHGVTVCLGHSNATADQVYAALEAGASGFTHLFNAMSGLTARQPGMIGAALYDEQSYCSIILDQHHVSKEAARLALKCKTLQRLMLVTDAMAHVNCKEDVFAFFDTPITRDAGKLVTPDGTLAGTSLNMHQAVHNAMDMLDISMEEAIYIASVTPAAFLGMQNEFGLLDTGFKADMVLLDDTGSIQQVWVGGQQVR